GRDHERLEKLGTLPICLDVVHRRAAVRLEHSECVLGVFDQKHDATNPVGVLFEKAGRTSPRAHGGGTHHTTCARLENDRALMPALDEPATALGYLRKVQQIHVKSATTFEIVHVVVNGVDAQQAQHRLGHTNSVP